MESDASEFLAHSPTTLVGFVDRLEQGDGFMIVAGWVALADKSAAQLPIMLSIGCENLVINRFFFREDLAKSNIAEGRCAFVLLLRTDVVPTVLGEVKVRAADGTSGLLQPGPDALQLFLPSGWLLVDGSGQMTGRLFDPAVWLGRRAATLSLSGKFNLPLQLDPEDLTDHFEFLGDFPGIEGTFAPALISISLSDLKGRLQRNSNIPPDMPNARLVAETYIVELCSGDIPLAAAEFRVSRSGKGYIEQFRGTTMLGWAAGDDTTKPAEIDILWDNIRYVTVRASEHRDDLIRKNIVSTGGGFRYSFSNSPGPHVSGRVSALLRESGIALGCQITEVLNLPTVPRAENSFLHVYAEAKALPICIIVPIYNAADDLERCLSSLQYHVTVAAHLVLVDDCSPDPRIGQILDVWKGRPNVTVIENSSNLGFSSSINLGIAASGRSDVVLLNSDTIVTVRWLEKLRQAAYSTHDIATVTALSGNAGAFSVPEIGTNVFPSWLDPDSLSRLVQNCSGILYPEAPTGNGFCMYVRRDCLDAIGMLDAEAFPRGYGEENDFCMRAVRKGYRNIVDDRTFIHHKRSASFGSGETKLALYNSGRAIVSNRYPEYDRLTSVFSEDPAFLSVRWRVRNALAAAHTAVAVPRPRVLYVISTQSGGTPQTNRDLMGELADRYEPWLMRCDAQVIELSSFRDGMTEMVESRTLRRPLHVGTHLSAEYDTIVAHLLTAYAFELVHVRHIAWHSLSLPALCQKLRIPVLFSFHDFYAICPTVKLLDENHRFCAGRCTPTDGECKAELWPAHQIPPLKHRFIHEWQGRMNEALRPCDAFITTSPGAAELLCDVLPVVAERGIAVIPHGRSFEDMESIGTAPAIDEPLRILLPGNINPAKGSDFCEAILAQPGRRQVEFHVLGDAGPLRARPGLILHGRYKREEFGRKARAIRPHVGAVFSIWPETYCHTLTEMWAAGLPVVAVDLGAVGERIRQHGGGWLVPVDASTAEIDAQLRLIRRGGTEFDARRAEVARWQATYGRFYTTRVMSDQYDLLYRRVVRDRRILQQDAFEDAVVAVVSQFVPGRQAPASAHIRIGETTRNRPDQPLLFRHYLSAWMLEHDTGRPPSAVVVQRDTLDPEDVDEFVATCRSRGIRIVLDCDDDLLSVPESKDLDGRYRDGRPALRRLLAAADLVSVSTAALLDIFQPFCTNVRLIPNTLSARLWLKALPVAKPLSGDRVVAIYAGTNTHDDDLQLLQEPVRRVRTLYPNFEFHVIGGQRTDEDWFNRIGVPAEVRDYPEFVHWFRVQCQLADFAVAPLIDSAFNSCKSDLKFLDYAAAGLAGIFSDVPSYRGTVQHGVTGLLVQNQPDDWTAAIARMIVDPSSRRRMAAHANGVVCEQRMALEPGLALQNAILDILPRTDRRRTPAVGGTGQSDMVPVEAADGTTAQQRSPAWDPGTATLSRSRGRLSYLGPTSSLMRSSTSLASATPRPESNQCGEAGAA